MNNLKYVEATQNPRKIYSSAAVAYLCSLSPSSSWRGASLFLVSQLSSWHASACSVSPLSLRHGASSCIVSYHRGMARPHVYSVIIVAWRVFMYSLLS
jgi:hypothetical protein